MHAPIDGLKLAPAGPALPKHRKDQVATYDETFSRQVDELFQRVCMWMVRMESESSIPDVQKLPAWLLSRSKMMLHGLLLANQIRTLVFTYVYMHFYFANRAFVA